MSEYCGRPTEVPAQVTLSKAQRDRRKDNGGTTRGETEKRPKKRGSWEGSSTASVFARLTTKLHYDFVFEATFKFSDRTTSMVLLVLTNSSF